MSYIKASYLDSNQYCGDFVKGLELLEQSSIADSIKFFKRACESVAGTDKFLPRYKSYYGLSCLLSGKKEAISLCRNAVKSYPSDGDICMNLARAEVFLDNRLEALNVIDAGLIFSSTHGGLKQLKIKLGIRARKPLSFLPREHPLNVALGKRMRK